MRYELHTGKFGQYFHDGEQDEDMSLASVLSLLNRELDTPAAMNYERRLAESQTTVNEALAKRDSARLRLERLDADYQKVVAACLKCDPIAAADREDQKIEPPWEVVDRIRLKHDDVLAKLDAECARLATQYNDVEDRLREMRDERDALDSDLQDEQEGNLRLRRDFGAHDHETLPQSVGRLAVSGSGEVGKRQRVYYQGIVYGVCNLIDQYGIKNRRHTVCGTVDQPSAEVLDRLRALLKTSPGAERLLTALESVKVDHEKSRCEIRDVLDQASVPTHDAEGVNLLSVVERIAVLTRRSTPHEDVRRTAYVAGLERAAARVLTLGRPFVASCDEDDPTVVALWDALNDLHEATKDRVLPANNYVLGLEEIVDELAQDDDCRCTDGKCLRCRSEEFLAAFKRGRYCVDGSTRIMTDKGFKSVKALLPTGSGMRAELLAEIDELLQSSKGVWVGGRLDSIRALIADNAEFARLILAVNESMTDKRLTALASDSGLTVAEINELFDRSEAAFEAHKPPPLDFAQQMQAHIDQGLSTEEILERVEPDTAGIDLIELVKSQRAQIMRLNTRVRGECHAKEEAYKRGGEPR